MLGGRYIINQVDYLLDGLLNIDTENNMTNSVVKPHLHPKEGRQVSSRAEDVLGVILIR